jgi:hypothetical protein
MSFWRTGGQNGSCGGRGEEAKGVGGEYGASAVCHMYANGKMKPVETVPGMGEGGRRRMVEGVNLRRTSVNTTMYPHPAQNKEKKSLKKIKNKITAIRKEQEASCAHGMRSGEPRT